MDSIEFVSKSYVDSLMSGALKREIVETLPVEDIDTNTIYMVLDSEASTQGNVYNEYMYINNSWELIGTTATAGAELYQHNITVNDTTYENTFTITIINNSNEQMTYNTLLQYIINNGQLNCCGAKKATSPNAFSIIYSVYVDNNIIRGNCYKLDLSNDDIAITSPVLCNSTSSKTVTDNVIQL